MITVDNENYFDIAEALHACLSMWHDGQYSETYRLLCRSQFKPGMAWSESEVERENYYFSEIEELCKENKIEEINKLFDDIEQVMEERD